MFPFVPAGATLQLEPARSVAIRVGDIVCYPGAGGQLVAHRVVGFAEGGYRVRGDAQRVSETIPKAAVAHVVVAVEHRGLRYRTRSGLGRLLARLAVAGGPSARALSLLARGAVVVFGRSRHRSES